METTRLDELPVHNNSTAASMGMGMGMGMGNNNNNVVIQQYDPNMIPGNGGNGNGTTDPRQLAMSGAPPPGIDQRTLNELVSGVQRASGAGMTGLPSRDIPRESSSMQHDEQIKPNYIPREPAQDDYISRYESSDEVRENNRRSRNKTDTLEMLYTEFQMPILMGVVYFMFQMPALRTAILQFLPSMFNKDGNMNLQGLIMMSVGYSVVYYILTKVISTAESGIM